MNEFDAKPRTLYQVIDDERARGDELAHQLTQAKGEIARLLAIITQKLEPRTAQTLAEALVTEAALLASGHPSKDCRFFADGVARALPPLLDRLARLEHVAAMGQNVLHADDVTFRDSLKCLHDALAALKGMP